jgi:hypothetical protein
MTFEEYVACVLAQLVFTVLRLYTYRYTAPHYDGGGHDSGTSYSYHPRLDPTYSTRAKMLESFPADHKRTGWILYWLCNLVPGAGLIAALFWLLLFVIPFLLYWVFGYDENMPHEWHN